MLLAALLLTLQPAALAQPDRFGLPACSAPDQELASRSAFVLCSSGTTRTPLWTAHELKPSTLHGLAPRPSHFRHDYQLNVPSAYDSDFHNSGYSRGHLVPAADCAYSDESIRATFLLSNAVPQDQSMNNGKWRQIENTLRTLAGSADSVIIFSGPLFESATPVTIRNHQVAVPTHLFKVALVLQGGHKTMYAAIVPNSPTARLPLNDYAVSVQEVQRRTGLDFYSSLEPTEQQTLESARNTLQ